MTSWAAIAKSPAVAAAPILDDDEQKLRIAVLDANALITGEGLLNLLRFADKAVTTSEVLKEVRDKKSRQAMASLPFSIETREPSDESTKAVTKFARATGDLHSLSTADIRLIALARTIEISHHGDSHIRDVPPPPRQKHGKVKDEKALPGWGLVGGGWSDMDRINAEEEAAAEAALGHHHHHPLAVEAVTASRITQGIVELNLGDDHDVDDDEEEEAEGEWETAQKSKNAARRHKRGAARRDVVHAVQGVDEDEEEDKEEDTDSLEMTSDDDDDDGDDQPKNMMPSFESTVCSITADFSMQNVLLQMGLRLVTPDGRRIRELSRWVLRCTACSSITREMGRIFCPRCGNAALDKVKVTVKPDGTEQYGIKKKHILRGTRFSLPKPRGGRHNDVILREDVLMFKARKMMRRKKKNDELDPFSPEMGDTAAWFQAAALPGGDKGAAALLAGWKKNPNERKHIATNRRRK